MGLTSYGVVGNSGSETENFSRLCTFKVLFKSIHSGSLNILTIYSENKNGDTLSMRMQDSVIFKGTLSNAIRLHKSCSPPCFL